MFPGKSCGIQGFTGQSVRTDDTTSDRFRGNSEMGTSKNVPLGQYSDEGNSFSSGDRSIEEKLNNVFPSDETKKTSTETADVFVLGDEEKFVQITAEISEKEKTFTNLANATEKDYSLIADIVKNIQELKKLQSELKEKIQNKPLTRKDVENLLKIEPPKKSVQNMTEPEVAKTIKFETMLDKEMGGKSPYAMRKNGGNDWRNDESKTISIVDIQNHDLPENITLLRKSENIHKISTGTFKNLDTDAEISFGRNGIDETVAKAIQDSRRVPVDARMNALYHMEEIIKNSICFDSQTSAYNTKSKSPNTMFMHRFYGIMKYNDELYLTNLAVEETYKTNKDEVVKSTDKGCYSLRDIKITPINLLGGQTHALMPHGIGDDSIGVNVSIPQLYKLVKTLDQSFFENPNAAGRETREAELYLQAKYTDTVNSDANKTEMQKQIVEFAKSHNVSVHQAKRGLEELVSVYDSFPANGKTKSDIKRAENSLFNEKVKAAFEKVAENNTYTENQEKFMNDLKKFTIVNNVSGNPIDAAFKMNSRFKEIYNSEHWVNSNVFNGEFETVANKLISEFKIQMQLLKQEKVNQSSTEKENKSALETVKTDMTKGVANAPQIQIAETNHKIDMEEIPQLIFLETDNSSDKFHFSEIIFNYNIEDVSVNIKKSSDNTDSFDNEETVSADEGASQINEMIKHYADKNMHISIMHENGDRESLTQYVNRVSYDYPMIESFFNNSIQEFANPLPDNKKAPKSKIYTVDEYNALLKKASENISDGQSFKLHFKVILSEKRSYSETFELTKETGKLSEILTSSESNTKYNRNFLKSLKMTSEKENNSEISKKSENKSTSSELSVSETQEYPYVSVKFNWKSAKYFEPEIKEKNYTIPEFNNSLQKLSERWDGDEYEGKSAFVTLTIHISETESFEKRLYAEYQFEKLSEFLEYDDDTFDTEVKLRQTVREAENQSTENNSEKTDEQLSLFNEISDADENKNDNDKIPENEKPVILSIILDTILKKLKAEPE